MVDGLDGADGQGVLLRQRRPWPFTLRVSHLHWASVGPLPMRDRRPHRSRSETLIITRMRRSGMRWFRTGGRHTPKLRTLIKSDRCPPPPGPATSPACIPLNPC
jgi:hypothetical protein